MKKTIKIAIAAAFLAGTAGLAMAQGVGNTGENAAASGGAGTHTTAQKTGSAANTQKVMKNQNGYQKQQ